MNAFSGAATLTRVVDRTEFIQSVIDKYHPGLEFITGVSCDDEDFYGEWDESAGLLTFTTECDSLSDEEMAFVVLHEIAHALTCDGRHQSRFYGVLTALVISENIPWTTAIRVEQVIPLLWEIHLS